MADIIVDTYKLERYAQRISDVNRRINRLDRRLNNLYTRVGLLGLWNLIQADALTCANWKLVRCQAYLEQTAADFEQAERALLKDDPVRYRGGLSGRISVSDIQNTGRQGFEPEEKQPAGTVFSVWDSIKSVIADIPADIKSAGEALAWIEKRYGKFPDWITLGIDVLLPGSLKDAYILTSGILQGDLTPKDVWGVAKNVLSENTRLAVICETIEYTFGTGTKRLQEMEDQIYNQIGEGDILGALFDGAEGFVDTIIGGAVECFGDVIGNEIDDKPVIKGISMVVEYGTGLLGCNDGEGYSVGGLIGEATEKISGGIDVVTDVVTDAANVVTDAVNDGFKFGIDWVKSCFD